MIASLSSSNRTLLRMRAEATMYLPAGKCTLPPPVTLAFSIARVIARVSFVQPSPVAPKSLTSNVASLNSGSGMFGGTKRARVVGSVGASLHAVGVSATTNTAARASCFMAIQNAHERMLNQGISLQRGLGKIRVVLRQGPFGWFPAKIVLASRSATAA